MATTTMQAIVQGRYGDVGILRLADVERPGVGSADVRVRVRAAAADIGVWHLMMGHPYVVRLAGYGLRRPKVRTPGMAVAGEVEAVGAEVTELEAGDRVFGWCTGGFAEFVAAKATQFVTMPAGLTFEAAAGAPISAMAALHAVRNKGAVRAGQSVLVIGAGGGVGTFAVQIAKAFGAEVTGVCSTAKVELVRSLGADHVIDYTREEVGANGRRYDVILDMAGMRSVGQLRRALAADGTLVMVGGENGGRWLGGIQRVPKAMLIGRLTRSRQRLVGMISMEQRVDLLTVRDLIASGAVRPVVDRTYPLAQAADALRFVGQGHAAGKVIVTI